MDGQKRLKNARVLCVGAGGLGSPALMYLAAAGVGTLGIIDFDVVDESNLQRQVIHGQSDIGRAKAESARDSVLEINPLVQVKLHSAGACFTPRPRGPTALSRCPRTGSAPCAARTPPSPS